MRNRYIFFSILSLFAVTLFVTKVYPQAQRKVLFEEWTSATCGPCASNNPILNAYIEEHWDTLTVVKYHVGWPAPGNDPMYLYNSAQINERLGYYPDVNAVPWLKADGVIVDIWPFTIGNFQAAVNTRLAVPTPVAITVTDLRIPGDSIKATVVITKLSTLPSGSYYLRVMAVERTITYPTPPGTNGETVFPDVFRRAFPNVTGTSISPGSGTETYIFKYKRDSVMVDSMMYTIAFLQNDASSANKEVINSGRAWGSLTAINFDPASLPQKFELKQNYPNPFNPSTFILFTMPKDNYVTLKVYDMLGSEIRTLVDGFHKAGSYNIFFDGSELATGVYIYKLTAGDFADTKKMVLIK